MPQTPKPTKKNETKEAESDGGINARKLFDDIDLENPNTYDADNL